MTASRDRSLLIARLVAVAALLVINVSLVVFILQQQGIYPFVDDDVADEPAEADAAAIGEAGPASTAAANDGAAAVGRVEDVDDWPGGRGPAPDGPPVARQAVLEADGTLILTGSAPTYAVVTELVERASARLAAEVVSIDNRLTWHPDAPADGGSRAARLAPPLLYPSGQIGVPAEAQPGLDLVARILGDHPTVIAVVAAYTDDLGETDQNAAVAFARSTGVVDYLTSQGVSPSQLVIVAPPAREPAASNETAEGRTINRRVELRLDNLLAPGIDAG